MARYFLIWISLFAISFSAYSQSSGLSDADFATSATSGTSQSPFNENLDSVKNIKPEHVVKFSVVKVLENQITLKLFTRLDFKIYAKGLIFSNKTDLTPLSFTPKVTPKKVFDTWYNEEREIYETDAEFEVTYPQQSKNSKGLFDLQFIYVKFESCSLKMCLLPTVYKFVAEVGESSKFAEKREVLGTNITGTSFSAAKNELAKNQPEIENPPSAKQPSLSDSASIWVAKSLRERSIWLFPALFLAGLLMNLTPCVYPMIPITVNVLGRFGVSNSSTLDSPAAKNSYSKHKYMPFIYVLGMVLSYSTMGVFAAMTGTLFGSILQSVAVNIFISILMIVMAFAMLGAIDLSKIQIYANKIPISEKFPTFGVLTMGVVSGLVSAPCTGPVLSALLLLITQTKDPFLGFILMFFFALGFGAPYVALGFASQKIGKLPKAGTALRTVKFIFAALMFGLAFYFLRPVATKIDLLVFLYAMPTKIVVTFVASIFIISMLATRFAPKFSAIANFVAVWSLSTGSLWLTLSLTNAFETPSVINTLYGDKIPAEFTQNNGSLIANEGEVPWEKDWKKGVQRAYLEQKPVVVDVWAKWCVACVTMDKTVWRDKEVVKLIAEKYVAIKLDFTSSTPFLEQLITKWDLSGLPAVGFFSRGANMNDKPQVLFREALTSEQFLKASEQFLSNSANSIEKK